MPDEEDCGTGSGSWEASVQSPLYGQGVSNPRTTATLGEGCGPSEPVHGDPSAEGLGATDLFELETEEFGEGMEQMNGSEGRYHPSTLISCAEVPDVDSDVGGGSPLDGGMCAHSTLWGPCSDPAVVTCRLTAHLVDVGDGITRKIKVKHFCHKHFAIWNIVIKHMTICEC